ncbi:MAG TPA: hypothetical protein VG734_03875 [Lacunisphaera sp.]|nr:hypothetical protein [Lacunisphaera sp.]
MNRPDSGLPFRFEATDASVRAVLIAAGMLVAALAGTLGAAAALQRARGPAVTAARPAGSFRDGWKDRTSIERDQTAGDALSRSRLEGYGWIDRDAGIVRIPIERAMDLTATRAQEERP